MDLNSVRIQIEGNAVSSLDLSNRQLCDIGILVKALKSNTSITTLDLSHNALGGCGAEQVADILSCNSSIVSVDLSWNGMGPRSASHIAEALMSTTSLTCLNLSTNVLGNAGASCLVDCVKNNRYLSDLCLDSCGISHDFVRQLEISLIRNRPPIIGTTEIQQLDSGYYSVAVTGINGEQLAILSCAPQKTLLCVEQHVASVQSWSGQKIKVDSFSFGFAHNIKLVLADGRMPPAFTTLHAIVNNTWEPKAQPSVKVEKRIDPADGKAYTCQQLQSYYRGQFSKSDIDWYFADSCKLVKGPKAKN